MKTFGISITSCILVVLLNACAFDVVHVKQIPTEIVTSQSVKSSFKLEKEVDLNLGTGYSRTLREGTRWNYVGTTPYGDVFKTSDQILTVEASNIHEAYIVVASNKLVGFYLPVEHSYSPLSDPVELSINTTTVNP